VGGVTTVGTDSGGHAISTMDPRRQRQADRRRGAVAAPL